MIVAGEINAEFWLIMGCALAVALFFATALAIFAVHGFRRIKRRVKDRKN